MNKRYQVFVSSTFADLREERSKVITTLMEMDCIPSGMELFPAADEEQWEFIKKVIDDCDYYLLIIGGRYGSTTSEGISYTEKEYNYAVSEGMQVIALLHENPDEIPIGKSEKDPSLRERLNNFRENVASNRIVKFWNNAEELPGLVALSISKTIKTHPATGWIRADSATNPELLSEINSLRKKNEELKEDLKKYSNENQIENLASLNQQFEVSGTSKSGEWSGEITWKELFGIIAPHLLETISDSIAKRKLDYGVFKKLGEIGGFPKIDDEDFQTIKVQLLAHNLIETKMHKSKGGGMLLYWSLTEKGKKLMLQIRSRKEN